MHAKRISWLFLLGLLVTAPVSAQWFIHYQTPENDMWRQNRHEFDSEAQAMQFARNDCQRNSNIRTAKILGPGKETVYQCQTLIGSRPAPATTPTVPSAVPAALPALIEAALPHSAPTSARGSAIEAMHRITGATQPAPEPDTAPSLSTQALILDHCEQDREMNMLANCQCARAAFAARPSSSGNKSGSRLALEACPAAETRIADEYHRQCVKDGGNLLPEDVEPVCRCMAADFAAKYTANPVFDVPHLSQLRETAWHYCMARR